MRVKYPLSIDLLLAQAREKDQIGRRSKWYLEGSPERVEATGLFREAAVIAEYVKTIVKRI